MTHVLSGTAGHVILLLKMSLAGGSEGKASACSAGDPGLIPGLGRSPGGVNGNSLPVLLKNPMDGGA